MDGPNNLLGRLALEKMWPEQYRALREITEIPYVVVSNVSGGSSGVNGGSRALAGRVATPPTSLQGTPVQLNPATRTSDVD